MNDQEIEAEALRLANERLQLVNPPLRSLTDLAPHAQERYRELAKKNAKEAK